jgi:hypothetical protein
MERYTGIYDGDKIKIEKFVFQVGKSVILCQFILI